MLQITCPWCGPRDQSEFSYGGEAHIVRPLDPQALSDEEWAEYLFMRDNPKGRAREQWVHTAGCRCWFNVERDTVSYKIVRVYVGADPEQAPQSAPQSAPQPVPQPATTAASAAADGAGSGDDELSLEFDKPVRLGSIARRDPSQ